jgi:hypothetical protein
MMHPQPTTILMPNPDHEKRIEHHHGPGLLLSLLVALRGPIPANSPTVSDPPATGAVSHAADPGGRGARVRSGLGGRVARTRRRGGASALRRGDIHVPGRGADRRGR